MAAGKETRRVEAAIEAVIADRRIPGATYRLQFHPGFTFKDATDVVAYLDDLGITDLYASPIFTPRAGSMHGYDVSDPTRLNPELGSVQEFDALAEALQQRGMGLILDIVPNHMGIQDERNTWWWDVLENGPSSPYAAFFDIQWNPIKPELENRVLLPVLGDQYGVVLESRQLQLTYGDGAFFITYYEHRFPVAPDTYALILSDCLQLLREQSGEDEAVEDKAGEAVPELESILTAVGYLPSRSETDLERVAERRREKEIIKRRLAALYDESRDFREALDATVTAYNGVEGDPRSMDLLDALVEAQAYRLAFWRVAGEEINYRRFFDINDLAALRVEDPEVFAASHALALQLVLEGKATGLRIDHPDGLYDPPTYFRRLQEAYLREKLRAAETDVSPETVEESLRDWSREQARRPEGQPPAWPLYVVAEKILSEDEPLPLDWAVHGTTGYDFLASANALLVNTAARRAFDRIYKRFTGRDIVMPELTMTTKMLIMRESLASEMNALSFDLDRISERNRHYRDFTLNGLQTALREVIASLSVYRTYINPEERRVSPRDRKFIQAAVRAARRRRPGIDESIFRYVEDTLLLRNLDSFRPEDQGLLTDWVMRFQQLTGPVMAKGVEDTAFYRYYRLASLNEVGASPVVFGLTAADFHRENDRRRAQWPCSMLALSTHDNKRSEDVRARISVLSEAPEVWRKALTSWARLNAGKKSDMDGDSAPDRNDEYLLYQTLLGAWPIAPAHTATAVAEDTSMGPSTGRGRRKAAQSGAGEAAQNATWGFLLPPSKSDEYTDFCARIAAYMQKAANEAKFHTSWTNTNEAYDEALRTFVERVLKPGMRNRFLNELALLARKVAYFGQFNALTQVVLKLTSPGVPDTYQGNELWDFSLVDPDNRRPVDYSLRSALLAQLHDRLGRRAGTKRRQALAADLLARSYDGRIKLYVTHCTLKARRDHAALCDQGDYEPLEAQGSRVEHVCAFARRMGSGEGREEVVVVVPRLPYTLSDGVERPPVGNELWADTWIVLPDRGAARYQNLYTGETLALRRENGGRGNGGQENGGWGLPMGEVLAMFPVALLVPTGP